MFELVGIVNATKEKYFNIILGFVNEINGNSKLFNEYKDIFLNVDNDFTIKYAKSYGIRLFLLNCIHSLNRIANAKDRIGLDCKEDDKLIMQLEQIKLMKKFKYCIY